MSLTVLWLTYLGFSNENEQKRRKLFRLFRETQHKRCIDAARHVLPTDTWISKTNALNVVTEKRFNDTIAQGLRYSFASFLLCSLLQLSPGNYGNLSFLPRALPMHQTWRSPPSLIRPLPWTVHHFVFPVLSPVGESPGSQRAKGTPVTYFKLWFLLSCR